MVVSARAIAQSEKKRNNAKKEYYRALLDQFCRKIKTASEIGNKKTILTVPSFLIGFPKYDLSMTVMYMARQLSRLGYIVDLVGPLDLQIRWTKEAPEEEQYHEPDLPTLAGLHSLAQKVRSSNSHK